MKEIKMEMVITNPDSILETSKRLEEISKELIVIGYRLQAKLGVKEEQPENDTGRPVD